MLAWLLTDASGKVRIWDTTQAEHILKIELHLLGGPIQDMAWSEDSKRLAVVGQGKEKFGAVVGWDTGASVGEISGHSKTVNTVDMKQSRPYRLVTGSEDLAVNFFEGPPFKFKRAFKEHQRFVNAVRYAPNGEKFISVSSDKTAFIFDGKTGEKIGQLDAGDGPNAHKLGIYGAAWSPDSAKILTVSADKTARLWDAANYKLLTTFTLGTDTEDQQLGCIWNGAGEVVSVALTGFINFLDLDNPEKPKKVVRGHNKRITALAYDRVGRKVYSGDFGARLLEWDVDSADTALFEGAGHENQISAAAVAGDSLYTISMDDSLKISSISGKKYGERIALDLQPTGLAVGNADHSLAVVVGGQTIIVVKGGKIASRTQVKYDVTRVAINAADNEIAVGGKDFKVHVYGLNGSEVAHKYDLEGHRGEITALSYSPDGQHLAVGDGNREVVAWKGQERKTTGWVFHTTSINAIAWSPDNIHIASVGTDSNLIVWNVADPNARIVTKNAHYGGALEVVFINDNTVLSAGQDCALKSWTLKY